MAYVLVNSPLIRGGAVTDAMCVLIGRAKIIAVNVPRVMWHGGSTMRFVECVDYGDAKTEVISGVASISLISPGMVEIRFYQIGEGADGATEYRLASRQIWDRVVWLREAQRFREALVAIDHRIEESAKVLSH